MKRHKLIYHLQQRQRFTSRLIVQHTDEQQPLRPQSLAQALGLHTSTTYPTGGSSIPQTARIVPPHYPPSQPPSQTAPDTFVPSEEAFPSNQPADGYIFVPNNQEEISTTDQQTASHTVAINDPQYIESTTPITDNYPTPVESNEVQQKALLSSENQSLTTTIPPAITASPAPLSTIPTIRPVEPEQEVQLETDETTDQPTAHRSEQDSEPAAPSITITETPIDLGQQPVNQADQHLTNTHPTTSYNDLAEQPANNAEQPSTHKPTILEAITEQGEEATTILSTADDNTFTVALQSTEQQPSEQPRYIVENAQPVHEIVQRPRRRSSIEEGPQAATPRNEQIIERPETTQHQKHAEIDKATEQSTDNQSATQQPSTFSPQEWYARLLRAEQARAERETQTTQPTQSTPQATTTPVPPPDDQPAALATIETKKMPSMPESESIQPISQQAQRFLRPLVGIDPASVHIHRGQQAEQITNAYRADAVTSGNDIALAAGHPDENPTTLGLLAHELTHIARQRTPRFVPPITRSANTMGSRQIQPVAPTQPDYTHQSSMETRSENEEVLASRVETQVKNAAQHIERQTNNTAQPRAVAWGTLPAPWEPLPDWLVTPPEAIQSQPAAPTLNTPGTIDSLPATHAPYTPFNATSWATPEMRTPVINPVSNPIMNPTINIQRAGWERSQPAHPEVGNTPPPDIEQTAALETDLDELARQVYTRLKHRLSLEKRREQ